MIIIYVQYTAYDLLIFTRAVSRQEQTFPP